MKRQFKRRLRFETLEPKRLLASISPAVGIPPEALPAGDPAGHFAPSPAANPPVDFGRIQPMTVTAAPHAVPMHGESGRYVANHHDPFLPDFSHPHATAGRNVLDSSGDGEWATQFGSAGPDDVVVIRHNVVFDGAADVHSIVVRDGGTLRFDVDGDQSLRVVNLQVLVGGRLEIGTEATPHRGKAEVVFKDVPFDPEIDPAQYGNGIVAFGSVSMHGRHLEQTFATLAAELTAGDTVVPVDGVVNDWAVGDRLLIPDSRQLFYTAGVSRKLDRYDLPTVASIGAGQVGLTRGINFDHLGARDADGEIVFRPHVANLTRSIVFRSENPSGVRGHTMFIGRADVDIRYVEFRDLGRTTNAPVRDTEFDAHGTPLLVGANQSSRYPVHLHHLIGPLQGQPNGYQFTLTGNSIHSQDGPDPKWGVTLHGASYGMVDQNVIYRTSGAGIVTEDGSEVFNTIRGNFISRISGTRGRGKFTDGREGSGIWLRRPLNDLHDNVVSGAEKAGYAIYGGDNTRGPDVKIPLFQGADPHAGDFMEMSPEQMHITGFDGNEAYASHMGVDLWYLGFENYYQPTFRSLSESVIRDLDLWHINHTGIFAEQAHKLTVDGLVIVGSEEAANLYNYPRGIDLMRTRDVRIIDFDVQNMRIGVSSPVRNDRRDPQLTFYETSPFALERGFLANGTNVKISTPIEDASGDAPPRRIVIRDVRFRMVPIFSSRVKNIELDFASGRFANPTQLDVIEVVRFDGMEGANFQLFYHQQSPEYVIPSLARSNSPAPRAIEGHANADAWREFGVAIGGEVAPGAADDPLRLHFDGVDGLAFPRRLRTVVPRVVTVAGIGVGLEPTIATDRVPIHGFADPGSTVFLELNGNPIGTAIAAPDANWRFDDNDRVVPSGRHVLSVRMQRNGQVVRSVDYSFSVFRSAPELIDRVMTVREDDDNGSLVGRVQATDLDFPLGDTVRFEIRDDPTAGAFTLDPRSGTLRVADHERLSHAARPTVRLRVAVVDQAGLRDEGTVEVQVAPRPPGEWVRELRYQEFGQLKPDEIEFLTEAQLATIPNAYWLSRIPADSRAAFAVTQVRALQLGSRGMIAELPTAQRASLTAAQIGQLAFRDLRHVPASLASAIRPDTLGAITSEYWFRIIDESVRRELTTSQVRELNTEIHGLIAHLTKSQVSQLSDAQIRRLAYRDFGYLTADRVVALTAEQLESIPDMYWFSQMSDSSRHALTADQVNALRLDRGLTRGLNSRQIEQLTEARVHQIPYSDFGLLPAAVAVRLSDAQLDSIPSEYWFLQIVPRGRDLLASLRGVSW